MRRSVWIGLALGGAVLAMGCSGGAKDEAEAFDELRPKPMTDAQKQMIEKIKQGSPPPTAHAGAAGKP